jgi:Na+/alanine symporter
MAFLTLAVLTLISARVAQLMAISRGRSALLWMWLAAFCGPLAPGALAMLSRKRPIRQ